MQGIKIFNFNKPGPTTLIVGLVHGNEIVGQKSIQYVQKKIKEINNFPGKIITLYANPRAHMVDKRFIDCDLNRAFDQDEVVGSYEIKRANQIKKYFENIQVDYMFDLHSTPSKSDPMILCTSQKSSLSLSSKMPIQHVIYGLIDIVEGTSLLRYFQKNIQLGMAFECGCHKDASTIITGQKIIDTILDFHQGRRLEENKDQVKIRITDLVHTSDPKFEYTKPYKGFEKLKKGEIRGRDATGEHSFNKSKILVMPNTTIAKQLKKHSKVWVAYFGDIIR